jgi:uncharacterized protein
MKVVLDTNVWVAAGFNPGSSSAEIVRALQAEDGPFELVWDARTRDETREMLRKIPPLDWERVQALFSPESQHRGETRPQDFEVVADPADRHFAALAAAAGAALVTNDEHLLSVRGRLPFAVLTPGEVVPRRGG